MEAYFKLRDICVSYGEREILKNVSFHACQGSLTALIGLNGCGKTTLLKSIANRIRHKGLAYLNEKNIENMSIREISRKISYIPQKSGMDISIPVIDVVLMGFNPELGILENPTKFHRAKAEEALELLGIGRYKDCEFQNLSVGEKQLVFLARTMVENTELLLLDEPDSALDFHNRYFILDKIRKMTREHAKVCILCLHDPMLAMEYCDQLILIKDAKVIDILRPKTDSLEKMEVALRQIYGNVSLVKCSDKRGGEHLTLLWEEE